MVAMKSTGVYRIPVYEILETHGLHVVLANVRGARAVSGGKPTLMIHSGFSDCMPVVCCVPASIQIERSPRYVAICVWESDIHEPNRTECLE